MLNEEIVYDKILYSLRMSKGQFENLKDIDTSAFNIVEGTHNIDISFDEFPSIGTLTIPIDEITALGDRKYFSKLTEWFKKLNEERTVLKNES